MKKTVICGISMKEKVDPSIYKSNDKSIPVSDREVRYPVNAFLERTINSSDELRVILLAKQDEVGFANRNLELFKCELNEVNDTIGAKIEYVVIDTAFSEEKAIHEQLMGQLVDELEDGSHIIVDVTYGPKDLPIVIFTALNFAEKFLGCEIDNIVYGKASFLDGKAINTEICDMVPLYYLGSVTNTIRSADPQKARTMLKSLLSL